MWSFTNVTSHFFMFRAQHYSHGPTDVRQTPRNDFSFLSGDLLTTLFSDWNRSTAQNMHELTKNEPCFIGTSRGNISDPSTF